MNKTKVVVLGIIQNEKGEVLVTQRWDPEFEGAHLKWDLPGGTNEFGESLAETISREIQEEVSLTVDVKDMMPFSLAQTWELKDYNQHTLLLCYKCVKLDGEVSTSDEKIHNALWINRDNLEKLDFLPTSAQFISAFFE
jgi:8-oxo-dGTP diphosphatase